MQEMTRAFNDEKVCKNLYGFIGEDENEYLPHGVTENEFLERLNPEEYINKSDETVKQDCESKAFVRLAAKIKKKFPRLPIIIAADGLYVSQNVLQICKEYHWDYIIRYKEGSAPSIADEYRALPEKETMGKDIEFQNQIMFYDYDVNLIYYRENLVVCLRRKRMGCMCHMVIVALW